jgi:XTP/dITP diphosphohydrolase
MNIEEKTKSFRELLEIVYELREKCPWDKEQTWESLRIHTIEEVFELADAIIEKDFPEIEKELGDVLLHILFYSRIGEEEGIMDIGTISRTLKEKLIRRHPHIYGDAHAEDSEAVKRNWEQIKLEEGHKSTLSGVPKSLPALVKAMRLQEKASSVGFDWENKEGAFLKVLEEISELDNEIKLADSKENIESEFGDILFSLVNFARFIGVNPENALEKTNKKFINRFKYLEEEAGKSGRKLKNMTLQEMDLYWNMAKVIEKTKIK